MNNINGEEKDKIYLVDGNYGFVCFLKVEESNDIFEARCQKFKEIVGKLNQKNPNEQMSFEGERACPKCHNLMKFIKAGVSKKSGKPYGAFYSCKCGHTEKA